MAGKIQTPYGLIEWRDEVLEEGTIVTVSKVDRNGENFVRDIPLSTMIAMTNGGLLQYLPPHPNDIPAPAGVVFPS